MKNVRIRFTDGSTMKFNSEKSAVVGEFTIYNAEGEPNHIKMEIDAKNIKSVVMEEIDDKGVQALNARRRRRDLKLDREENPLYQSSKK